MILFIYLFILRGRWPGSEPLFYVHLVIRHRNPENIFFIFFCCCEHCTHFCFFFFMIESLNCLGRNWSFVTCGRLFSGLIYSTKSDKKLRQCLSMTSLKQSEKKTLSDCEVFAFFVENNQEFAVTKIEFSLNGNISSNKPSGSICWNKLKGNSLALADDNDTEVKNPKFFFLFRHLSLKQTRMNSPFVIMGSGRERSVATLHFFVAF